MSNFVNLLDIVYPIGSVYITFSDVSPADSVGGSWEKIDGKFLQSSSEIEKINSTGGFSGNIGFSISYGSWYGALIPTWNKDVDLSLFSLGNNSPSNSFNGTITKYNEIRTNSSDTHFCNSSITDKIGSVNKPVLYKKEIYWDTRPAYITCNMYKRIA